MPILYCLRALARSSALLNKVPFTFVILLCSGPAFAAELRGRITDPLGSPVAAARIELLNGNTVLAQSTSDGNGRYTFAIADSGRYGVRVSANGFGTFASEPLYVGASREAVQNVTLKLGTVEQSFTVTATGVPAPESQVGASVTVLDGGLQPGTLNVDQTLRLVNGLQAVTTGQLGGATSLFLRGGDSDANKVLIDGVPANDIGGGVNFTDIPATGLKTVEVYRGPNSALFGSDAEAGVVSFTATRGTTPLPLLSYAAEGGNFSTYRQDGAVSGTAKALDYSGEYARFDTRNSIPGSAFHNGTLGANFGYAFTPNTSLRATVRRTALKSGEPGATYFTGLSNRQTRQDRTLFVSATLDNQANAHWHNLARYGLLRLRSLDNTPGPYGVLDTSEGATINCFPGAEQYVGLPVTLKGANGYSASGQAYVTCPGYTPATEAVLTNRDFAYGQTDYALNPKLIALAAFRYESERGYTAFDGFPSNTHRGNYSTSLQISGNLLSRLYYTIGSGLENNAVYGFAATPRASLAYYVAHPGRGGVLTGTKLRFNFAKGILEPTIGAQNGSLYNVLRSEPNGAELISQFHVHPVGAQQSRTYDGGVDQDLFGGKALLGLTYFHNEFGHQMEYVLAPGGLEQFGVDPVLANQIALGAGAAYLNSLDFSAQGIEASLEYHLGRRLFARAGYTYLDAKVQRSLSSDNLFPSSNPNIPGVPIGAYSPLVGQRPFRRAPHTGFFAAGYAQAKWTATLSGTFVGRRDDSTFLTDAQGGTTLLLPNRNLDSAYQRLQLTGTYQVLRRVGLFAAADNLLSQHAQEAFGYPTLPFTFRAGMKFTIGGEDWKLK